MAVITTARHFISAAPREAVTDALGLMGLCALIFAGFCLPGLI